MIYTSPPSYLRPRSTSLNPITTFRTHSLFPIPNNNFPALPPTSFRIHSLFPIPNNSFTMAAISTITCTCICTCNASTTPSPPAQAQPGPAGAFAPSLHISSDLPAPTSTPGEPSAATGPQAPPPTSAPAVTPQPVPAQLPPRFPTLRQQIMASHNSESESPDLEKPENTASVSGSAETIPEWLQYSDDSDYWPTDDRPKKPRGRRWVIRRQPPTSSEVQDMVAMSWPSSDSDSESETSDLDDS
ncbi:hypothetical protein EDC01DRAFT_466121 [Geopyxis carbonaria]|nr:hypothetical protein EDC01DRAFT_466121 [Geopyxis carbonaria]